MNAPSISRALRVHPSDTIIVALEDLAAGSEIDVDGRLYVLTTPVTAKHKFSARPFSIGDVITMYGVTVGRAVQDIPEGAAITTMNVHHAASPARVGLRHAEWEKPSMAAWEGKTFAGYHRTNGQVGTANHWLVIPLVFCENRNLQRMRDALLRPLGYAHGSHYERMVGDWAHRYREGAHFHAERPETSDGPKRLFAHVDGVKFLAHTLGCGGTDADSRTLCGLLAGYISHPNVAGATVLSLGCQKAQFDAMMEEVHRRDPGFSKPVHFFEQQKCASEESMMTDALAATFKGMSDANELRREAAPLGKLVVGVECGGSDGFSGISANPVIGAVSDRLVALGGAVVLSEFPELCGVEQNLVDRCVTDALAKKFLGLMEAYQKAAERVGAGFDQNPSHGNIRDGLITDAMKSAGAARKGGSSPVTDVLDYPEPIRKAGLNLLCTPGNDVESTTAMAGSGANIMVFSTGLGTPTGNPVAPVIKISTNSDLARRLPDIIDFDAGLILSGEQSIEEAASDLLDIIARTAGGEYKTCAERLGQDDFIPWKRGVSL